jgi:predicted nuclease with TOPRIM domain
MATEKEKLIEEQEQVLLNIDFMRNVLLQQAKTDKIKSMIEEKIDQLLDKYNDIQNQIDQL